MKTLVIEIVSKKQQSEIGDSGANKSSATEASSDAVGNMNTQDLGMTVLANYSMSVIKSAAKQTANYFISDIGRSYGDSNYQAMVNRSIEIVSDGVSILSSAASGAMMGASVGGPFALITGTIGATIGAISASIGIGFKYAERERAYQHEMFQQNNSQAYQLARANYSVMTGRVR